MNAARKAVWVCGGPVRAALISTIRVYRATLSGLLGGQCRFYPSCSVYAEGAVRTRGALVGTGLAAWRVLRCNPFGEGGLDPVPAGEPRADATAADEHLPEQHTEYDGVTRVRRLDHEGLAV